MQPPSHAVEVRPPPPPPLLLFITNVKTARTIWVEISINDGVSMLKQYASRKTGIPVDQSILIYQGEELKNDYKIKDCRLPRESTIHLLDLRDTPTEIRDPAEKEREEAAKAAALAAAQEAAGD